MTKLQKVLLTIIIAMTVALLCGNGPHWRERLVEIDPPNNLAGDTDIEYLQRAFKIYNHAYFHDRVNTPTFDVNSDNDPNAATTLCKDNGTDCHVHFNLKYTLAPRFANIALLHEICHIKTWPEDQNKLILGPDELTRHGKHWRACMLEIDNQGVWRSLIIDFYHGAEN